MEERELQSTYRVAWLRVALGSSLFVVLPPMGIDRSAVYGAGTVYLASALVQQLMLRFGIGGAWRPRVAGVTDILFLTFLVHRLGSMSTVLIAMYIVIPIVYAMLGRTQIASFLAAAGIGAYSVVLILEGLGVLPIGPDQPDWVRSRQPRPAASIAVWIVTGSIMIGTTSWFVVRLARRLAQREAELLEANQRLETISYSDPLTGLANRRYLMTRLQESLSRVDRGRTAALVMIDLDGFKRINDDLGHLEGDAVLQRVATALASSVRPSDLTARYGGDEFMLLLEDVDSENMSGLLQRLLVAIREAGRVDADHRVTGSIGIALLRPTDATEDVIARADALAYEAKQEGGDRWAGPEASGAAAPQGPPAA